MLSAAACGGEARASGQYTVDVSPSPSSPDDPAVSQSAQPSPTPLAVRGTGVEVAAGEAAQVGEVERIDAGWVLTGSIDGVPAVWTSSDALRWDRADVPQLEAARGHLVSAVGWNGLALAVGWTSIRSGGGVVDRPLVVVGRAGGVWRATTSLPVPDGVGARLNAAAAVDGLFVIAGELASGQPVTWTTADEGAFWDGPYTLPTDPGSSVAAVIVDGKQFVAVGEAIGARTGPAVWRSDDGVTWNGDVFPPGSTADAVVAEDSPIAIGHGGDGRAAIWRLDEPVHRVEGPPTTDLLSAATLGDKLVVTDTAGMLWIASDTSWTRLVLAGASFPIASLAGGDGQLVAAGDDGRSIWVTSSRIP